MIPSLIEAALRSVLVAIAVWAGLRVFRVSNVLAQKAAWGLVLATAIFMPMMLPVAARLSVLPTRAALVLPPDPETLLGKIREQMRPGPVPQQSVPQPLASTAPSPDVSGPLSSSGPAPADTEDSASPLVSASFIAARTEVGPAPRSSALSRFRALPWKRLAFPLYAAIAVVIVGRLVFGLALAFRIRLAARPVVLSDAKASGLRLCSSPAVSSPVTIGSSIILPADYESWDSEKLRIVLAHERSHIRQGDFYLQLLAGLYAALFWFSPLGWWLKHKLSDLAEAISDHAGLQQAASRSSYAQVLLEFAAAPRPTLIGVAMARTGSISRRIERLLNDSTFRQAFAGTRRRAFIAVLLVPVALFAATALVRVQAAGQAQDQAQDQARQAPEPARPPAQAAPPAQPDAPVAGVSSPDQPSAPAAPNTVTAPPAPASSATAPPAPAIAPEDAAPQGPPELAPPPAPPAPHTRISRSIETRSFDPQQRGSSYRYSYSSNGESFAIIRGDKSQVTFSGDWIEGRKEQFDKARKLAHGDFLWFTRNGKSYFVDDPETVKQVEELYKPMELLGKQQEELGRQQEELGKKQEELGRQQEQASVPTPDVSKEIAEINAAVAKLQSKMGKTVTQAELADLQSKLGDLQGRLGGLQGEMGAKMGDFGAKMGALGAQQGKLGAQQGRIGAEQGKLAQQADQQVKSIIDQSLQNGKAHPVE
jgi:bla regulator protein blaR1